MRGAWRSKTGFWSDEATLRSLGSVLKMSLLMKAQQLFSDSQPRSRSCLLAATCKSLYKFLKEVFSSYFSLGFFLFFSPQVYRIYFPCPAAIPSQSKKKKKKKPTTKKKPKQKNKQKNLHSPRVSEFLKTAKRNLCFLLTLLFNIDFSREFTVSMKCSSTQHNTQGDHAVQNEISLVSLQAEENPNSNWAMLLLLGISLICFSFGGIQYTLNISLGSSATLYCFIWNELGCLES